MKRHFGMKKIPREFATIPVAAYRVFNADGSEAEQCANGVRAIARYLFPDAEEGTILLQNDSAGRDRATFD